MRCIRKTRTLISLDNKTIGLLGEAFFYLGWARVLKAIPFSKIAPSLGIYMGESTQILEKYSVAELRNISFAIHIMSRYTWWESKCLVKAIAGMRMLERRHIDSTIYLGTAKDENGNMIAHAWLRSGPIYITGAEEMLKFTPVAKFAKIMIQK